MTLTEARNYSDYQLRKLQNDALYKKDVNAQYTLEQINLRLKREANNRLEILERHGYKLYAYQLATSYTKTAYNSNRFKGIELTDPKDLRKQIMQMKRFLDKRTSQLVGQQEVEKARIETFMKRPEFAKWGPRKIKRFLKWLGDTTARDIIDEHTFESGENITRLFGAFNKSKRADLERMIERYELSQNLTYSTKDEDFLGYDELIKYLDDPSASNFKKVKKN